MQTCIVLVCIMLLHALPFHAALMNACRGGSCLLIALSQVKNMSQGTKAVLPSPGGASVYVLMYDEFEVHICLLLFHLLQPTCKTLVDYTGQWYGAWRTAVIGLQMGD